MYTHTNYKTKKSLREAVKLWVEYIKNPDKYDLALLQERRSAIPHKVTYFQPGPFGGNEPADGSFCVEGPHYPQPHKWYASCTAVNGIIVKVT